MKSFINDFVSLFYPRYCNICTNVLLKNEECICLKCMIDLPKTNFHLQEVNPLSLLFYGKVNINAVTAYYYFKKGNITQTLIHQLKYKGCKEIGFFCGFLLGRDLIKSDFFKSVDVVIPIPLHPKKYKKRGYNQSEEIAKGVAKAIGKELNTHAFIRKVETTTQTKKMMYKRWENTSDIFSVIDIDSLVSKHILLIDDVITTGSTLESAAITLLSACCNTKVSIACLACTSL